MSRCYKLFAILLLLVCTLTKADPLDIFINTLTEQEIVSVWVLENAQNKISEQKATSIVKDAFVHSLSSELSPKLILAVMRTESGFITNAKSNHGAVGLMQVLYRIHHKKFNGRSPLNQSASIDVGTQILKECFIKHHGNQNKTLNCYSGGGGKVYIAKVTRYLNEINHYVKTREDVQYAGNP